ncbi:MAG: TraR/DksA family transcriptional regulator [Leptothrix ochracea]|uniref:TraR/DksA family transcriptional regulator n=1 Tax=Leptothrix ochracea TaxID=735331 RepID=UPI0034E2E1DF
MSSVLKVSLSAALRAELREVLLARRGALEAELALHEQGESRVQHATTVLAEAAQEGWAHDADREVDLAMSDREHVSLAEINAALSRLDGPDFGVCGECGDAIAPARLLAQPQALRCTACETMLEARQGVVVHPRL